MGVVVHRHEWSPTILTIHDAPRGVYFDFADGTTLYLTLDHTHNLDLGAIHVEHDGRDYLVAATNQLVCANDRCRLDVHHDGKCDDSPARAEPAVYVVDAALIDNLRAASRPHNDNVGIYDAARAVVDNARPHHCRVDPA